MTKAKSNVMSDFGAPIIVLVLICAIMSGLLAATNNVTAPIIAEAERKANEEARLEVMPEADGFEQVEIAGVPDSTTGYGGKNTLKMTIGIDMDGKITDTKVLSHSETAGLGSKITSDDFRSQFPVDAAGAAAADTISGATFSSNYYKAAIADAFAAFEQVKG